MNKINYHRDINENVLEEIPTHNFLIIAVCRWKFCVHADKRQMLEDLTLSLQNKPTKDHVLWELASCISNAVGADGFHLYIPDSAHPDTLGKCLT